MTAQHQDTDDRIGSWAVDITRTVAAFEVKELGLFRRRGTVPVIAAAARFNTAGGLTSVSAELDPAGVRTGNPKRDRELQGPRFFATEQNPLWTFQGAAAVPVDGGWTVPGRLTVREQTRIDLHVRPAAGDSDPRVRMLDGTAVLDRREAGLRGAPGAVIGHRIQIALTIALRRV